MYVCMGKESGIHTLIYRKLLTSLHLVDFFLVPIAHTRKAHFTLLYIDLNDLQWYYLNIYIKTRSLEGDKYFKDALKMVLKHPVELTLII